MLKAFFKHFFIRKVKSSYILVLDVGTSGIKAFVFDANENIVAKVNHSLSKSFPKSGWVEQNPQEIITIAKAVLRDVTKLAKVSLSNYIGFGITTQRETVLAWDKQTSEPIYPAIVWQDIRTEEWCKQQSFKHVELIRDKTGLPLDPYFSASKIRWLIKNIPKAKKLLQKKQLAVGTIDSWLLWNLVQGSPHVTDYTNASRTLLFNIKTLTWDEELLAIFDVPHDVLPVAMKSDSNYGILRKDILNIEIPILAVAGDQQASLYAAGVEAGTTKITYGTGTFTMQISGSEFILHEPFFTTLAINSDKQPWYALEAKATSGIENADEVLKNPVILETHLKNLVQRADDYIKYLPQKPMEVVIDGGWIRDGKILQFHKNISTFSIREQKVYDGTALGIDRLIQKKRIY